ncbi:MAG: hypothetical protein AAGI90_03755 [Chlamydiota bacterium]
MTSPHSIERSRSDLLTEGINRKFLTAYADYTTEQAIAAFGSVATHFTTPITSLEKFTSVANRCIVWLETLHDSLSQTQNDLWSLANHDITLLSERVPQQTVIDQLDHYPLNFEHLWMAVSSLTRLQAVNASLNYFESFLNRLSPLEENPAFTIPSEQKKNDCKEDQKNCSHNAVQQEPTLLKRKKRSRYTPASHPPKKRARQDSVSTNPENASTKISVQDLHKIAFHSCLSLVDDIRSLLILHSSIKKIYPKLRNIDKETTTLKFEEIWPSTIKTMINIFSSIKLSVKTFQNIQQICKNSALKLIGSNQNNPAKKHKA